MGLFHRREEHAAYPPEARGAIKGNPPPPRTSHSPKRGLFHRGSSPSSSSSSEGHGVRRSPKGSRGGGLFHRRNREDPSITAARQTLASAEDSERAAGRAAEQARMAVADAKENVKRAEVQTKHEYVSSVWLGWPDN